MTHPMLTTLQQHYGRLKTRERALIVMALLIVVVMAWMHLVFDRQVNTAAATDKELKTLQTTISALRQQQAALLQQQAQDPYREVRERLVRTQQATAEIDSQLKDKLQALIEPQQMAGVLEAMLKQNGQLQLQRIQALGAKPLLTEQDDDEESEAQRRVEVYRHGVEIEFTGSYLATLDYLQALQALPWAFYWDAVLLEVDQYPKSRVVIIVHTLSLREGWIGV